MYAGLIDGAWTNGTGALLHSVEAATGTVIDPGYPAAHERDVEIACAAADAAFDVLRELAPSARAAFLEAIAEQIVTLGDALIDIVVRESGLPRGRIESERGRTCAQLRFFADVLREGSWAGVRIDPALPHRAPLPRPDLRLRMVPLGPVAVFGASNFPLAFSVAGGDTVSALAAGCPVIVKAHSAHLGTSVLIARAVDAARRACGLPAGVFQLLIGERAVGTALVADPRVKAVGFTGSRTGGLALARVAAARREPIPVYAEMSSVNPVLIFPAALAARGHTIATGFAQALTLGTGQFCTNPGLLIALDGPDLDTFLDHASAAIEALPATTMLTPGIHTAYVKGVEKRRGVARVCGQGAPPTAPFEAHAHLFEIDAAAFLAEPHLHEEIFGPAALLVRCGDVAEMTAVIGALEGQLTAALHVDEEDYADVAALVPLLERKAGRLLVNGFGTGVEVAHAMVHGGPFPATSDSRSTSVGSLALDRFLRPVCYQSLPDTLLPAMLRDDNPFALPRRIDGKAEL
ncbi:aldehyde dehydrogenase (NADP(+)) [Sphingomonas sp. RHCKR47]|uniref:aldehyde dehydrogenase (NADP(+)) n=1 Tax=Sphingomonas citricola TaxID=2862498 RepID=UPI001C668EB5|nr:aldehyde dehydrogenase (NADP(+)) [Sphingomonas citricola]MBW6525134.1 aldehyde dehydrogenase (NADP(+)) [Sphingomonas citricola]